VKKNNRDEISLRINSVKELINFIIPHFLSYPLLSQKAADFLLFKEIIHLITTKINLQSESREEALQQIINLRASMNLGLSDLQKSKFINSKPVYRQIINSDSIPDLNWIAGFTSAEGCFSVSISQSNRTKIGQVIQLKLKITQHNRDKKLLELIVKSLNCGAVYSHSKSASDFQVVNFEDITKKIIPFFNQYSILGVKYLDFTDWCNIATLMGEKNILVRMD